MKSLKRIYEDMTAIRAINLECFLKFFSSERATNLSFQLNAKSNKAIILTWGFPDSNLVHSYSLKLRSNTVSGQVIEYLESYGKHVLVDESEKALANSRLFLSAGKVSNKIFEYLEGKPFEVPVYITLNGRYIDENFYNTMVFSAEMRGLIPFQSVIKW